MSALLLDDALKPATPLTNGAINQTLRQFAPLSAPELPWIVNIDKPSMKEPPQKNSIIDGILVRAVWKPRTCQAQSTLIMQLVIVIAGLNAMSDNSQGSVV